jgi:hypothetical protein
MPLLTYRQTRPWASAIREQVLERHMPPWFADPRSANPQWPLANNPSLTRAEIDTLSKWAKSGAPAGSPSNAPKPRVWPVGWSIPKLDAVFEMPRAFDVPASGDVEYQYVVIPTGFTEDKWVQQVEVRPGARSVVHHAVIYIREPSSRWLREAKPGIPYSIPEDEPEHRRLWTTSDLLVVYAPGNPPVRLPQGMAKLIPARSDLVLQMHYQPNGHAAHDKTRVGLVFSRKPVQKRVLTLQMGNDRFIIPPGHPHFPVEVSGTLPNRAELLSLFPHMHLRGSSFEFDMIPPGGKRQVLLLVDHYSFHWQLSYQFAKPVPLAAGTRLDWLAYYDNSAGNPDNPDPTEAVRYGEQSRSEMMIGFFDVAVPRDVDKQRFFVRRR